MEALALFPVPQETDLAVLDERARSYAEAARLPAIREHHYSEDER